MLDIAWPELMVIGAVALVAIGPKDLPKVMHKLGQWAGKARSFAHDMHRALEQAAYEAETAEKAKTNPPKPADTSTVNEPPMPPPGTTHE